MNTLKKLTPVTLWEQLYNEIKGDIESGKYKPGDKIPTEFELKDLYNVSRVTVRAAIQQLVDENILIRKSGKGTFVKEQIHVESITKGGSFTENCRQRGAKPSTVIVDCKLTDGPKEILADLEATTNKLVEITRIRYVDDVPCIVEVDYFREEYNFLLKDDIKDRSLIEYLTEKIKITPETFTDFFTIDYANKEYASYLNCPIRTPLLEVRQVVKSRNGKVIYINKQFILTSKYIYVKSNH